MQRILIADDSATIRKMVRASLQALQPAEFLEAGTGLEAIEQLAVAAIHLVVLDLNMPDMHGIEVLRFLASASAIPRSPVIVLTTRGDDASRERPSLPARRPTSQSRLSRRPSRQRRERFSRNEPGGRLRNAAMGEESSPASSTTTTPRAKSTSLRPGLRCWSSRRRSISLRTSTASSTTSFDSSTR